MLDSIQTVLSSPTSSYSLEGHLSEAELGSGHLASPGGLQKEERRL